MSRLATAKILESKGDVAGAEKQLRTALQAADESEQVVLTAHLMRLRGNQGRVSEGAVATGHVEPQQPAGDPVDRLISVLNTGDQTPAVTSAIRQLGMLGDLVVPHLLRAFPKLGPFGVMNSLQVLRHSTDARIAPFLVKQIETASVEVQTSIIHRLVSLPKSSALPVAMKVAQGDFSEKQKLVALTVLLTHAPEAATCRALSHQLFASDVVDTRLKATLTSLNHKDLTEAMAIKALKSLPKKHWENVANHVREPGWSTFGMVILAEAIRSGTDWQFDVIRKFVWKRVADEAAPLLLTSKRYQDGSAHPVTSVMNRLQSSGWRLPKELDDLFAAYAVREGSFKAWEAFVELMPDDAEDRAIALWERSEKVRYALVYASHGAGKQWFRLTVRHLLNASSLSRVKRQWLQMNWSKAPKEAIDGLVAFAEKWPRTVPNENDEWAKGLIEAYEAFPSVPLAVVRPLVLSGEWRAWKAVSLRDPGALLQLAGQTGEWGSGGSQRVAIALANHGTSEHVALALRVLRSPADGGTINNVQSFFRSHAKGNLELIAAAAFPDAYGPNTQFIRSEAEAFATRVDGGDLNALLELMPRLSSRLVDQVWEGLSPHVTKAHAKPIGEALLACLKRERTSVSGGASAPIGTVSLSHTLAWVLEATKSVEALPYLEEVLQATDADTELVKAAARVSLAVAGDQEAKLVHRMLQSKSPLVVAMALRAKVIGTDDGLRDLAAAAVLRLAKTAAETGVIFDSLRRVDGLQLAKTVLEHEDLLKFHRDIVQSCLNQVNGFKDARYIPLLKNAVKHGNGRVRERAAQILGNTFTREAAHPLLDLLKDDESYVRSMAQDSLNQIANYLDEREKWEQRFGK